MVSVKPGTVEPLDDVTVKCGKRCVLSVRDGQGREYVREKASGRLRFRAAGALGTHVVSVCDTQGRIQETTSFAVHCSTAIDDEGGRFKDLLSMVYGTLMMGRESGATTIRLDGKFYTYFVCWLRDHVHTMKAMKHFYPGLKTGIELYADYQRDDGMIWDNIHHIGPHPDHHDQVFAYGRFTAPVDDGSWRFLRVPVENDVEYLFLEGLYYTWKATGDTAWMAGLLDKAARAIAYTMTDPLRWSTKFGLLKRGHTIDTWDYQADDDIAISGHMMVINEKTRFNIMHGDNTGFLAGCRYMAEMLRAAGRAKEAPKYEKIAAQVQERLDKVAWTGRFFRHQVPEDPSVKRDYGVDPSTQVSLSNTYDLNRGITHEQCVAIIREYQRIRAEMPTSSPGEFYMLYPPFERGYSNPKWEYMNGGVSTICAGELAHGAFEHGFERYGADILERVAGWGRKHGGHLHCCLKGALPEKPRRQFFPVDTSSVANNDFSGDGAPGVPAWIREPGNNLSELPVGRQVFREIPFEIIDPARNGRRGCLCVSPNEGDAASATVAVDRAAHSVYLLHTLSSRGGVAGWFTLEYADGSQATEYVVAGEQAGHWFTPGDARRAKVAWRGPNKLWKNAGVHLYGYNNPHPEKKVRAISFTASQSGSRWFILGVTLSDKPVWFDPGDVSYGIPDNWGAAAIEYALIEGLAGMKDTGVGFDRALLAPRWSAAGVNTVTSAVTYPACDGYLKYRYAYEPAKKRLRLLVSGTAGEIRMELLLPEGTAPARMSINGKESRFTAKKVESSAYLCADLAGPEAKEIEVLLKEAVS